MSDIINPFARQNVQISDSQRMCVLVHKDTKRILCFARDDPFARKFAGSGYEVIEILHAHEFDKWAKKIREQEMMEHEEQEYALIQREKPVRDALRKQLTDRLKFCTTGAERATIHGALAVLEAKEAKRKRYLETFMLAEAVENVETKTDLGENLVKKIICNE